jgi:hypothetical protein
MYSILYSNLLITCNFCVDYRKRLAVWWTRLKMLLSQPKNHCKRLKLFNLIVKFVFLLTKLIVKIVLNRLVAQIHAWPKIAAYSFFFFIIMRRLVNNCKQRLKNQVKLRRIQQTRANYVWWIMILSTFN